MGRKPLSAYTEEEELKIKENERLLMKIEGFFNYDTDFEEIESFVTKNEGTEIFWKLIATLVEKTSDIARENEKLEDRVRDLEKIIENIGNSFRTKTNEYEY